MTEATPSGEALTVGIELRKAIANAVLFNDQVASKVGMSHSER